MKTHEIKAQQNRGTSAKMAAVFNEWNRQYSEDPESFSDSLDENGKPIEDYGEGAAATFHRIAEEMEKAGTMPE